MDNILQAKKKTLEIHFHQLKIKQAICRNHVNLLEPRAEKLHHVLNVIEEVEEQLSRFSRDVKALVDERDDHTRHDESAITVTDKPEVLQDGIHTIVEKINRCEDAIQKEISRTNQFLKENFMMMEKNCNDIEQISHKIHQLQENGFPE